MKAKSSSPCMHQGPVTQIFPKKSCASQQRNHPAAEHQSHSLLNNLFVLEMANNHWGDLSRALDIVRQFSDVVRANEVKAAIKIQLRDVDSFIHRDYRNLGSGQKVAELTGRARYVQKTRRTQLNIDEIRVLARAIEDHGCIPLATPFDERSVDLLVDLGMPAIKLASADLTDWGLLEHCAATRKPMLVSSGGLNLDEIVEVVNFLKEKEVHVAVNHCVSNYPTEDLDLQLNQVDVLKRMFPDVIVGLSTHEYSDWQSSMLISYAKGVRTWERHIDIPYPMGHEQAKVSPYCSMPHQIDTWFKAFHKAREMCGTVDAGGRKVGKQEVDYLTALKRGAYFARDVRKGEILTKDDFFFAIPLHHELCQLASGDACKTVWRAREDCTKNAPATLSNLDQTVLETGFAVRNRGVG